MTNDFRDLLIPSMKRCSKHLGLVIEKKLAQSKNTLTLKQFVLLLKVSEQDRFQSELAIITDRDKGSLTRLIQSLERKNLITRYESTKDKRIKLVRITEMGMVELKNAEKIIRGVFSELTCDMPIEEQQVAIKTINKLMSNAVEMLNTPEFQ